MTSHQPTRDEALQLLEQYNSNESLINHALAVEAAMRFMARRHGEDEVAWGVIGLIHDLDYEQFPEQHCHKTIEHNGWPPDYIRAVVSHGWDTCTDVEPQSVLEKTLYAIDELTGLLTACALVRPSRSVMDLTVKSVKKKWEQKGFAAGASREIIQKGADMLGIELDQLIDDVTMGMRDVAGEIGQLNWRMKPCASLIFRQ